MRQKIRLTENDLHRIVKNALNEVSQYNAGRVDARNIAKGKGLKNYPEDPDDDYHWGVWDQLKKMMYQYIQDNGLEKFCEGLADICTGNAYGTLLNDIYETFGQDYFFDEEEE